ncbi:MAG TPA: LuxR C-terminal-related transcriptional regulator [Syntrophorhabdaceae bacterium]|jgi:DNA-binding CsgD family transcriptional regulator
MSRSFDASLDLFKAVFETAPDIAVNLLDKDYRVLWANEIMAKGVDRPLDEMIGKPCYEVWRRRSAPCPVCLLKIVSDTRKPCVMERWLDLPNQERRYAEVRAYPIFDARGLVKYVFEIIIPLTDRKKGEKESRRYIQSLEKTLKELNSAGMARSGQRPAEAHEGALTLREKEIVRLMAQGFSNKQIAGILSISPDTVKTHVRNIFSKLGVTDRTRAAVWAASHKLV